LVRAGGCGMKSMEKGMQVLSRAVLKKARADAEHVLDEAKLVADGVRQQAQQQAKAEREKVLERARQEAERIRGQAVAVAQLEARKLKLEQREELLDEVLSAARQRLPTVQQWTDYDQIVDYLVREAVVQLKADQCRVRVDERAQQILTPELLAAISTELGVQVQMGETLEYGLGAVTETMDGRRQYDNTLEARLDRQQEELRFPVHRLLMGEPL
jgi:V/A-type H+/Na+-transporting ATPase subunit E